MNFKKLLSGRRRYPINLIQKLDLKDRYTNCNYCCYGGCQGKTYLNHLKWVISLKYSTLIKNIKLIKYNLGKLDYSQIENVEVDGIDTRDYPDFCDAFISSASYKGRDMSEKELDRLNNDSEYVYACVMEQIY